MRFLRSLPAGSSVFEAGAGDGRFTKLLSERGYAAEGIEPSETGWRRAIEVGAEVRQAELEEIDLEPGSRDAVVAWHVLEHLADPKASLDRIHPWLRPDGRAIIAVPNIASLQAALAGDRWFHQDVPRHRTHFTPDGLRILLERCGFRVESLTHLVVEHNALGMWQSLLNLVTRERNVAFRLIKRDLDGVEASTKRRDIALTLALAAPLAIIAVALELGAGLAGRGGTVVAVAKPA